MDLTITTYSDTIEFSFYGTDDYENFYCFEVLGHVNGNGTVVSVDPNENLTRSFKALIVEKLRGLKPLQLICFDL